MELSKMKFSTSLIKLIGSFPSQRKFRVLMEGEMSTPRVMQARVPQDSVLSPTLFNMYINDAPQTHGVNLVFFEDGTSVYATDRKESFVIRKLKRDLSSVETGVRAVILKLMKIRLGGPTSLVAVDRLSLTSQ
jgi:hypothetical protein